MTRFRSPADVTERLAAVKYLADEHVAVTVYLADQLEKPILCEGPAGVGKTELAKAIAAITGHRLTRLQCYEGLDEAKALYEWNYKKQLLRISPDAAFTVNWTAFMIFIAVIGGIGTTEGPIVGTVVFFLLREFLADYGSWYLILLGLIAVVVVIRYPQGLWGLIADRWDARFFPVQRRVRLAPPGGP